VALVTVRTLVDLGVPRRTAERHHARAARSWETTTVATRTKPALALVMPDDAYAALVASLAREVL
jgi:hypothetical protein